MSDVRLHLSPRDRVELLCWLTCGSLGAYYLNETWPEPAFHVQAAHKWLDRHLREADWLSVAKLSALALEIAGRWSQRRVIHSASYECKVILINQEDKRDALHWPDGILRPLRRRRGE